MISEKEHDKLLTRAGNGSFKSSRYSEAGPSRSSPAPLDLSRDGSNCSSSLITKEISRQGSKDTTTKKTEDSSPAANCKKKSLKVVVTMLLIVIVVGIVIIWVLHEGRSKKHIGNSFFDFIAKKKVLHVYNDKDDIILAGYLKTSDFDTGKIRKCEPSEGMDFCFVFNDDSQFQFRTYKLPTHEVQCVDIVWDHVVSEQDVPIDCFDVEYGLWFGLPNYKGNFWPMRLDELDIPLNHYRPYQDKVFGHVLENFWLSTEGVAIIAHQKLPLKVSYNSGKDRRLCITLDVDRVYQPKLPVFNYTICEGNDIKTTFLATRNAFFPKAPYIDYANHDFSKIIWNFEDKSSMNSDNFGDFLHKLAAAELPMNMIEYDSSWQKYPGDFRFDPVVKNDLLRYLGEGKQYSSTKLMLPITLACSYKSVNFMTGVSKQFFVKDPKTHAFQTIRFLNQTCGLWDATNPETKAFLDQQLSLLQKENTTEAIAFPQAYEIKTTIGSAPFPLLLYTNNTDTNKMNEAFLNSIIEAEKLVLMETAFRLQDKAAFIEIPTVIVEYNGKKCLDYMLSGALTAGIHGYSLVVTTPPADEPVELEMFIRWLEIAMFFPGLKVTNHVVNLGDSVAALTKNLTSYRLENVVPLYNRLFSEVQHGKPLLRPLWWIDPKDYKTLQIDDQFLIGVDMMVAPILCESDRMRDIYLPWGEWRLVQTGEVYEGHQWLQNFKVPLYSIPVFVKHDLPKNNTEV